MKKHNIFNFELKRLRYNKTLLWIAASTVFLLFIFISVSFFVQDSLSTERDQPFYNRENQLKYYEHTVQSNNEKLLSPELQDRERLDIVKQNKEYIFYIEHGSTEYDYLDISEPHLKINGYENIGFAFYFIKSIYYFLLVFSVLFALYIFAFDYTDTRIKNVLAAPINRGTVFKQKALFLWAVISIISTIFFLFLFAFLLSAKKDNFLIYYNKQFYLANCISIFVAQFIGLYLLMIVLASITAVTAIFTKNISLSAAVPIALYGIVFVVFILLQKQFEIDQNANRIIDNLKWMPFLNLQEFFRYGFNLEYYAILAANVAIVVCLFFVAKTKFLRQDL